jgi:translation initiation factor 1
MGGMNEPVVVRLDKSGRRGKAVTLVERLPLHPEGKVEILKDLQRRCGAGGTMKAGVVEIQGDHRERIAAHLESLGHRVRRG